VVASYEGLSGRSIEHFDWYETFALLRSTAILARIGVLMRAAGEEPAMPVEGSPMLEVLRARTSGPPPT
jgi:aminoglycoside phosphotransferase (APT) family kinase protein